jgi:hypothetical protein
MGDFVATGARALRKWGARAARLHPRMEITGEGLVLGAGTILAKMARDESRAPLLSLDDEPRICALLSTGFEKPAGPRLLTKIRRACEIWNEGEKALAHIHLAQAGLPPCGEEDALRLFAADELLESGVTPDTLMKAQGFDPAPLALLKYNPDQPRVPAGHGRDGGRWTSDAASGSEGITAAPEARGGPQPSTGRADASIILVSNEKERDYDERRARGEESPKEDIEHGRGVPLLPEGPLALPPPAEGATDTEDLQLPKLDPNKLHHIFDYPRHGLDALVTQFGSQESAFQAIAHATRDAIMAQGITGDYEIEVKVGDHLVTVSGRVDDGKVNIGSAYIPWTR